MHRDSVCPSGAAVAHSRREFTSHWTHIVYWQAHCVTVYAWKRHNSMSTVNSSQGKSSFSVCFTLVFFISTAELGHVDGCLRGRALGGKWCQRIHSICQKRRPSYRCRLLFSWLTYLASQVENNKKIKKDWLDVLKNYHKYYKCSVKLLTN